MSRRHPGEGSFFYSGTDDRWVGKVGGLKVSSRDRETAFDKWVKLKDKVSEGGTRATAPTIGELFDMLIDDKRAQGKTESTIKWTYQMRTHFVDIEDVPAHELTVAMVEGWLGARAYLTQPTLRKMKGLLAQCLKIAQRHRWVTWNPALEAQAPLSTALADSDHADVLVLTRTEVSSLLREVEDDRLAAWYHVMIELGLRPHESYELAWTDVDLEEMVLVARPHKAKANRPRNIMMSSALVGVLRTHRANQARERLMMGEGWPANDLVFVSDQGTQLDRNNMVRHLRLRLVRAGVNTAVTPYDLRRTCASLLADAGVPVTQVADFLGNHPDTLEKYYRRPVSHVRTVAVTMDQILSQSNI